MSRTHFHFRTSHLVMMAEEAAHEAGIEIEVVPVRGGAHGLCGLAIQVDRENAPALESVLNARGLEFTPEAHPSTSVS